MTQPSARVRAGVAGWPVAHSRSPLIHGFWLERLGIEGAYERFPVPPGAFAAFAAEIGRNGLVGSNVTVPHKEAAFAACDRRTPTAEALGAVNTLWREDGRLWGDNTDVAGFLANMDEAAPGWADRRSALVIGAGGAARAIVHALVSRGFERVVLVNRTRSRAEALSAAFGAPVVVAGWDNLPELLPGADCLVNTSTLGMAGQPPLAIDLRTLPPDAVVSDIVYVPLRTSLIEAARARGLRTVEGLGMLLHQAAPAFERWFGRRPEVTPELRALVEADVRAQEAGR
ncbi:shikimate dehydrogenase [Roseiarcus fermentans]|uniref:Shikimate dehydrogenase (NADP(+)) n=1 Tax=Roseiarcus fermentans TaxID=1473586 RepID=A0A366FP96_9HYPH|nr:shikimate dehydrogenase [Roseiarcus fermentans]RBP16377.1 shikimate dehydrogenase [Roseiarcus fermentans]